MKLIIGLGPMHSYLSAFPPETLRVCDAGAVRTIRSRLEERLRGTACYLYEIGCRYWKSGGEV
jgi:hypothetical protein